MKNKSSLSTFELNNLIKNCPMLADEQKHHAKKWQRVDVGDLEVYVGDRKYVISFVETLPKTSREMEANTLSAEETVMKYLIGEDFVDSEDFLYVGLQRIDLQDPPSGLDIDDE